MIGNKEAFFQAAELNGSLARLEERRQFARELMQEGGVRFRLFNSFDDPKLRDEIVTGLLSNPWLRPCSDFGNALPLQAKTGHRASASSVLLDVDTPYHGRYVDVVAKPTPNRVKAEHELRLLVHCFERGVNVVEPLGVMSFDDRYGKASFLLTVLKLGVIPLSAIRLEGIRLTSGDDKVKKLLDSIGAFVAHFHNLGLAHHDLHTGNIGLETFDQESYRFVLCDLEGSQLLGADTLLRKKNLNTKANGSNLEGFKITELKYLDDLAKLTAYIVVNNQDGVDQSFVRQTIVSSYLVHRDREQGQDLSSFNRNFEQLFEKHRLIAQKDLEKSRQERLVVQLG